MTELLTLEGMRSQQSRRYSNEEIDGLGTVRIRSLLTSEYARVESLVTRAMVSLNSKKKNEGQRLLREAKYELIKLCWVDAEGNPINPTNSDLDKLDYAFVSAFEEVCSEHCGISGVNVDDAAKN